MPFYINVGLARSPRLNVDGSYAALYLKVCAVVGEMDVLRGELNESNGMSMA